MRKCKISLENVIHSMPELKMLNFDVFFNFLKIQGDQIWSTRVTGHREKNYFLLDTLIDFFTF